MIKDITDIIRNTDLFNSSELGIVCLNEKDAETLAVKIFDMLSSRDTIIENFERQLKTERAKYSLAVECYREVYKKVRQLEQRCENWSCGNVEYIWHKMDDATSVAVYPGFTKTVLCFCADKFGGTFYTLGKHNSNGWELDGLNNAIYDKVIAWTEIPRYK